MAISKTVKEQMVNAIVAHGFDQRIADALKAQKLQGDEIYKDVYSGGVMRTMMALPDGFLPKRQALCVNWNGQLRRIEMSAPRVVASAHKIESRYLSSSDQAKLYESDNPLMLAYEKTCDALKKIEGGRDDARRQAVAVIDSCSSLSKLWKVWPEAQSVIGRFEQATDRVLLPTVAIDNLNAELGLPASNQAQIHIK